MENLDDQSFLQDSRVRIHSNGQVDWIQGLRWVTECTVDLTLFPFDKQVQVNAMGPLPASPVLFCTNISSAIIGVSVCDNLINNFTVWYIHTSVQSVCMYYAWFYCFRIAMSLLSAGFIRPRWYILPTQTQMWLSMALFQMVNGTCWRPVHIMEPWQAETGKCSRLLGLHWVCSVSLPITYTTFCYLWVCWWYCQWSPTSCRLRQERRSVCRSPFFSHFPSCCSSCLTARPRLALLHHSLVGLQGSLVLT